LAEAALACRLFSICGQRRAFNGVQAFQDKLREAVAIRDQVGAESEVEMDGAGIAHRENRESCAMKERGTIHLMHQARALKVEWNLGARYVGDGQVERRLVTLCDLEFRIEPC